MLGPSLRMQKMRVPPPPPPPLGNFYSGGYRGDSRGSLEPPFETKLFHFHEEFPKKKQKNKKNNSINYQIIRYNFQIKAPFVNLNPLARNPGSAPVSTILFYLHGLVTWASPYGTQLHCPYGCPYGSHIDC